MVVAAPNKPTAAQKAALAALAGEPVDLQGIELFKAGVRRDSLGRQKEWTQAELEEAATAYNEIAGKEHDAPILIGHDSNTAYGWLSKAYRQSDRLSGDYRQVEPEFAAAVTAGRYMKRSISLYPPDHPDNPTPGRFNIRHVAYVGVPAVKGMADHVFNDDGKDFITIEFGEAADHSEGSMVFGAIADTLSRMRDRLIESDGVEKADQQISPYAIELIRNAQPSFPYEDFRLFADEVMRRLQAIEMPMSSLSPYYSEMTTETEATNSTELEELRQQLQAERDKNNALTLERERDRVNAFAEKLVHDRKIAPQEKAEIIELALAIDHSSQVEFAEGNSATPRDRYLQQLDARKPIVSVGDMPTRPGDAPDSFAESEIESRHLDGASPESIKLDRQIRARMKSDNLSYAEAMDAIGIVL